MTLNASLRSRVQRLEQRQEAAEVLGPSETMRRALARRLAMSPAEAAAADLEHFDECVDALQLPAPHEHDESVEARLARMQRRFATRHLNGLSLLVSPVDPQPAIDHSDPTNCAERAAWGRDQCDRDRARRLLALVGLASGHYNARHL